MASTRLIYRGIGPLRTIVNRNCIRIRNLQLSRFEQRIGRINVLDIKRAGVSFADIRRRTLSAVK